MRLAIVIVNYETPELVLGCLRSLCGQVDLERDQVVVVDNGSRDRSHECIELAIEEEGWGEWVRLVAFPDNRGFGSGVNRGLRAVDADAYLLLNSDTLVRDGAVEALRRVARDRPEVGIISPRLEWPDETPQISCFRYTSPVSEFLEAARTRPLTMLLARHEVPLPATDDAIEPEWTSFACVLLSRAMLEEVGLLDEGYFMYFEDVDYCRRARESGWRILHWPGARVVHLRGGSSSVKSAMAARKRLPRYFFSSRSRYFAKFYGRSGLWLTNLLWLLGRFVSVCREFVGHKTPHTPRAMWIDIWSNALQPLRRGTPSGGD
jgi:GT2 family glycosyltransferase